MEKILVHISYPLWRKNALVALARAKELQDQGDEVTVTYCAAEGGSCICNPSGNPLVCRLCRTSVRETTQAMQLHAIGLPGPQTDEPIAEEITLADRKELVEGVLSGVISTFRVLAADVRKYASLQRIKRRTYQTALNLQSQLHRIAEHVQPGRVEVFNGRHACSKSVLLVARRRGIAFNTMEVTAIHRPIVFHGHTAHDRKGIQKRILQLPIDMELAEQYFSARRQPRNNRFLKQQNASGEIPSSDGFSRLVSVFLSSQDEFESLGKTWKTTFPPDHAVLEQTCRRFPETLFCIRFHPNQAGIKSDITSGFDGIKNLPNAIVFGPRDAVSTYQLVDRSDVVVAFNSTVGVEACWAGKPSIMLGPSFYDELKVAYMPGDVPAFWELLEQPELRPLDREGAAQFAYYATRDGDDMKYLKTQSGDLLPSGFQRKNAVRAVVARHTSTVCNEVIKLFLRAA